MSYQHSAPVSHHLFVASGMIQSKHYGTSKTIVKLFQKFSAGTVSWCCTHIMWLSVGWVVRLRNTAWQVHDSMKTLCYLFCLLVAGMWHTSNFQNYLLFSHNLNRASVRRINSQTGGGFALLLTLQTKNFYGQESCTTCLLFNVFYGTEAEHTLGSYSIAK